MSNICTFALAYIFRSELHLYYPSDPARPCIMGMAPYKGTLKLCCYITFSLDF